MPVSGLGKIWAGAGERTLTAKVLKSPDGPPQNGAKTIGDHSLPKTSAPPPANLIASVPVQSQLS